MGWGVSVGWSTRYVDAYYYAITTLTTVGYGDRTPATDGEKVFSIVTELAGRWRALCACPSPHLACSEVIYTGPLNNELRVPESGGMIFGILAGTLSSMLTEANAASAAVEGELDDIKNFMLSKGVTKDLRREVMSRMETFYKTNGLYDEDEVLAKLPPKFRKTLLMEMYKPQLTLCPLFLGLQNTVITKLAMCMQPYLAVEGDFIVQEGNVGDEMYMIVKGEVRLE